MNVRRYFMVWSNPVQTKQWDPRSEWQTLHGDRATVLAHKGPFTALER